MERIAPRRELKRVKRLVAPLAADQEAGTVVRKLMSDTKYITEAEEREQISSRAGDFHDDAGSIPCLRLRWS